MKRTWTTKLKAATGGFLATGALFVILGTAMTLPSPASAVSMTDYTWMPVFVGQNVPPNILFIVDYSNYTLQDAFSGSGHQYPISFCDGCPTVLTPTPGVTKDMYASNVTIAAIAPDVSLVAVDTKGVACGAVGALCPAASLAGQSKTGENGKSNNTCADNSKSCWRYVKFVPAATLVGRVPTTLPVDGYCVSNCPGGHFFGSGEGTLYVNDSSNLTANPFDSANANQVDLFNLH